ncbi:MAG: DUF971 domain-containing protein [Gammaproteobacteria bacterium]|jgi:DUF971 family protein|nr:DUF971 domain-containing protein [Gammaproteobacteria bacterium]MBU0770024.1 DUF971 domain-containing protein [Gammaproteobacteria bacterium]MBU0857050.1 DUF971 domain-containing protein [Gammaproteobacteria bacterium]MBU1848045.1 DUF971 domain-containing protein [Gammaproteobacteria bacterium]
MAGLDRDTPIPTEIKVQQKSRLLDVRFNNGRQFSFTFEFLRVLSPSAEVRGHGPGQETLQVGKRDVDVTRVEPVGAYAVKPVFSDGHESGIYSWDYLYLLGENQAELWADYLAKLAAAGASRDPSATPPEKAAGGCGSSGGGGCGHHH